LSRVVGPARDHERIVSIKGRGCHAAHCSRCSLWNETSRCITCSTEISGSGSLVPIHGRSMSSRRVHRHFVVIAPLRALGRKSGWILTRLHWTRTSVWGPPPFSIRVRRHDTVTVDRVPSCMHLLETVDLYRNRAHACRRVGFVMARL